MADFSDLWNRAGNRGEGARVALLDTGVDIHVPEFREAHFVLKDFCNPGGPGLDADGHGTHCAGAILRVSPGCTLLSGIIASRSGFFTYDALFSALRWLQLESVDVACICTGERFSDEMVLERVRELNSRGGALVASVGNVGASGPGSGIYPARHPEVIAAGSVNDQGELSSFTDMPEGVDVFCVPGEDIEGPYPGNRRAIMSGTSQAASLLTGMLGLLVTQLKKKNRAVGPGVLKDLVRNASVVRESGRGKYFVVDPARLLTPYS